MPLARVLAGVAVPPRACLLPNLSPRSSALPGSPGLLWHRWLPGHTPVSHAPCVEPIPSRPRTDHAPPHTGLARVRYTYGCDWLRVTTRQTAQNFVSVFFLRSFYFFFWLHSAEASLLAEAQRWLLTAHTPAAVSAARWRSAAHSAQLFLMLSFTPERSCQVSPLLSSNLPVHSLLFSFKLLRVFVSHRLPAAS